jgi:putative membrane protein
VRDHSKANKQLTEYARGIKLAVVAGLDKGRRTAFARLAKLKGGDFDGEYMRIMVDDHKKAVELFKNYSKTGKHEEMRTFAKKTLPTLEKHLKEAKAIQAKLKE